MKTVPCLALCLGLSLPLFAAADQVIREVPDTTAGKGVGTLSGLMLGAAAGGPAGAIVGAGAGFFLGGATQQGAGLSERAYEVESEAGERHTVRSPNASFAPGQTVTRSGSRIHPSYRQQESHHAQ